MQENGLEVRLEAEKERVGQFMLTAEAVSAHYAVNLDPEGSFALSDALRRLGPVLAGRGDPAGQMAPLDLMRDVGVRLWQGLLPATAPAQEREALAQALRDGISSLLLTLPDALAACRGRCCAIQRCLASRGSWPVAARSCAFFR